ncbi:MAG: polysaccharide deacetylase family protein [Candidatus Limnocylindrus sp.]
MRILLRALILVACVVVSAAPTAVVARARRVYHVPVLMYHRIARAPADAIWPSLFVNPTKFAAQMAVLDDAGWETITAAQLAAAVAAGDTIPRKTFVITFDDGTVDGYENALPILQEHGFVATFYVITHKVGREKYFSVEQVQALALAGMEIGNHTSLHVFDPLANRSETDALVRDAQAAIELWTGVRPTTFAYPYGYQSANLIASVRSAGIQMAFTTQWGARETTDSSLSLPRVRLGPWVTPERLVEILGYWR